MKRIILFLLIILFNQYVSGQTDTVSSIPDTINQRIFLIGDAGELQGNSHPVIDWLKKNVNWDDERNVVIFLGDNIYEEGLPLEGHPTYKYSKNVVDYQIGLVKDKKARSFFIPGNHDWRNGKIGGWEQVMNQVDYINSQELKNVQAWPLNGCPGPIEIELSDKVVLVLIDSQWFLFLHDKPGVGSNCTAKTLDEFQVELAEIVASHPNQMLIVATHHPLYSYGPHGGGYGIKEHIFPLTAMNPSLYIPLPVLGSVYPIARGIFGNVQDIPHPLYRTMINAIEEVMETHPYPVGVAGHEHSLQFILRDKAKDTIPFIVSGSGARITSLRKGKFSKFSDVSVGFAVIEVWKSGKSEVKYYNINSRNYNDPTFRAALKTILPPPPPVIDTTRVILDSVVYKAADPQLKGSGLKHLFVGKNYRKEWTEPLRLPVLDMGTELGGLKPVKQGGGKQTRTLRVVDASGKEWALRSVRKDPQAAIPPDLRQTFVKLIIQDGISASYPYSALSMETFSKAAGVPYLRNRLVYLPDDPRLSRFRADFKNMVALMEERKPLGVDKTDDTDELFIKLENDNDDHVDQKAVLKARLLDMFVMDFDRHEGQWLWATRDTGKGKIYYPIPKDRDQVFYINQGIIPKFARSSALVPELQGFRPKAIDIRTFNRTARNFDRNFLTELTEEDWRKQVDSFLTTMTDDVIERALKQQPPEIQKYSADKIIGTLKKRRNYFAEEAMRYYRFLSKIVTIPGSDQREQFTVTKTDDGKVHLVIHKIAKDSAISSKIYDRVFDPDATNEIRLFGLNDDDRFIVEGSNSPIEVKIIGGSGKDEFINNSTGKRPKLYDVTFEQNKISGTSTFRKRIYADPQVNRFDRLNFKYNLFSPFIAFEYNIDDGFFMGPKLEYIKQGFRKEPYGTRFYIDGKRAFNTNSFNFKLQADFIKAFRNTDILVRSDFRAPINVTNFFGLGNNTKIDLTNNNIQYYRARYNIINASVYFSQQLQSWMRINVGPTFQYFRLDSNQNKGRFVSNTAINGLNLATLHNPRHYLGADGRLSIDSRNNALIPTRGFVLDAGVRQLFGIDKNRSALTQVNVDMRIYMSLFAIQRFVLATRFGWGRNYGSFEFPQAMYLGGTDNLRGYRKQRFAGRSMLYNNTELRIRLADFSTYLFGGAFGLHVFNDVGRVFMDGEESTEWQIGYGAGFWIAPVKRFVVSVSLAHSKEEKILPRVGFGFQF